MVSFDFLIVGQGIAGTILADTMLRRGKKLMVIDDWNYSCCSKISAGLFNPVVFKRLNKSWLIDELLPFASAYYRDFENRLGVKLFFNKQLLKLFYNKEDYDFWQSKSGNSGLNGYLGESVDSSFFSGQINCPYGAGIVGNAGHVDVLAMLSAFRDFLVKNQMLISERLDFSEISIEKDQIKYKNFSAKMIIFCEGFRAAENPFFKWLPFKLSKGELLTVKMGAHLGNQIINKGVFILPLRDRVFKVGATHNWDEINEIPSENGRNELSHKLGGILNLPYEIVAHQAGVRPTVVDRRPFIGVHPENPAVGIFNGLGTKGVVLSPFFSDQFMNVLDGKGMLDKEADIRRYWN